MDKTVNDDDVAKLLESYSGVVDGILRSVARKNDLPENWNTIVTLRLSDNDVFHVQRLGCDPSTIYVNASIITQLISSPKEVRKRFELSALKAIKLASTLSNSGSALITGDLAYAITDARKRIRRSIIASGYNALDDRYISVGGTLRLEDKLSNRVIEVPINNFIPLDIQVRSAKQQLSLVMLQDAETEEVIDLLETSRSFTPTPNPTSYTVSLQSGGISVDVGYDSTHIITNETEEL